MKKKTKIIAITTSVILLTGGIVMSNNPFDIFLTHDYTKSQNSGESTKDRQIAFLKAYEKEMTDYIKKQSNKIESVRYDWYSIQEGVVGNGLPQGGGASLEIFGYVNGDKNLDFSLFVLPDSDKLEKIDNIYFGSEPNFS
jgi:hypothetical protein